jgi:TonB-linked SusC/RagA family outer membrane protein
MHLTALFSACKRNTKSKRHETKKLLRVMKLTAIILLSACMAASAKGSTQTVSINVKNASLQTVFKEIQKQSGYNIFYSYEIIQKAGKISVNLKNASVQQALDECLKTTDLRYEIIDNTVVIKEKVKSPNGEATIINEPPPPIDITGKVTDENGNPLIGASVKVKNSNKGTTTNNDGVFVLKGVNDDAVLEISYVGFEMVTVSVNNRTSIVTSLKAKPESLGEVVINKGYYTEKQRNTVSNVTHVDNKDIEKQPVQNPLLALAGRVPGLEVTQSTGLRGGGVKVRIQGQNSIRSGLDPLVVVDGVPFPIQLEGTGALEQIVQGGSPLNYINLDDIESIDILKDADATAIYGSRAANGAILITTKKGKIGRTKLTLNLEQGWGKVTRFAKMMNTRQYLDMRYEAYKNDGIDITTLSPDGSNYDLTLWDTTRNTDWQKKLIGGAAKYTNVNVGISGGTAAIQYLVGATYNRQTTVFPGNFDDKVGGLHFNINGTSTNQKLRIQLTGSYSYDNNHLPSEDLTQTAILMEPNAPPLYNADGTLNWTSDAAGNSTWWNPLSYTLSTDFINTTKNLVSNANLSYSILPGLEIRTSVGYTNTLSELYRPIRLDVLPPEYRPYSERDASFGNRSMTSWTIEPQMQYKNQFGKSKIDGLIGTSIQKNSFNYLFVQGTGFASDLLMKTLTAAKSINILGSSNGENRFNALFGRLNYSWNEKFLINLTGRRDGSNKFGDANKFHNFWSIGGGWIFSEEKWLQKNLSFLSFGKLRSSYGTSGNDQIPPFRYLSTYSINNPTVPYQNSIGLNPSNIPNPYLQWEETRKWQTGLDLGFFHDRVILGATYVHNRSDNQLLSYPLPSLTGFTAIYKNFPATIQNTALEFSFNTLNVKNRNFSWNTSLNLTIPRNKLVSFPGIENTSYANGSLGVIIGQPLGIMKTAKYAGMDPTNGKHLFIDNSGNPNPNIVNQDALISTLTKYYGGIDNTIVFKGFNLSFLIQLVRKMGPRDLYWWNGRLYPGMFASGNSNQPVSVLNHWQKPGDIASASLYSTNSFYSIGVVNSDAVYNYDASFIRLKNVSLSWQFPAAWLRKVKLQNARIYANAQNLLTITKYAGLDPETMSFQTLPPLRMITTGVQIDF